MAALFALTAGAGWAQEKTAAEAAYERGKAHATKHKWDAALAAFEEAARLYREAGDKKGEADAVRQIGVAHYYQGGFPVALSLWERAAELFEAAGDKEGAAGTLNNIGIVHDSLGDYATALSFYERGMGIMEEIGNRAGAARLLNNIGNIHGRLGDYAKALSLFERSLRVFEEIGDKAVAAFALNNIGLVHMSLGDDVKALWFLKKSLHIRQEIGDRMGEARALNNIGIVYDGLGDYAAALSFYEPSLKIREEIGDKPGAAATLGNIGVAHRYLGHYATALSFYERSLPVFEEIGDKSGAAFTLANLCHVDLGAFEDIIPHGERALALATKIGAPERIYDAHAALGAAYAAQMRNSEFGMRNKDGKSEDDANGIPHSAFAIPHSKALRHFRSAIETAESMRSFLSESEHKSGFLGTKLGAYEGLVELLLDPVASSQPPVASKKEAPLPGHWLLETGYSANAEAFAVAERMKARSFLDELGAAKFSRAGVPENLLQEKRLLEARIKWLKQRQ